MEVAGYILLLLQLLLHFIILLRFVQRHCTFNSVKEQDQFTEVPNQSCLGQAYCNRPGTGSGYENMEPVCILTVLHVPSVIHPLRSMDT